MKVFPSRRGLPLIISIFIIAGISCKNNHFFHSPYTFRAESKTARQFRAATKKGGFRRISLTLKPNRRLLVCLGLLAARFLAAGLGRISLLGAACSRRIALLGAVCASRSFGSGSGGSALGSLLVRISTAAYHCDGSQDDDKRDNLFHGVKHLIVNCSVTPQS